ncbi:heparan sulfate glucosamine 3-O-sulfotransferase 1-like [Glandiceps talaboti]
MTSEKVIKVSITFLIISLYFLARNLHHVKIKPKSHHQLPYKIGGQDINFQQLTTAVTTDGNLSRQESQQELGVEFNIQKIKYKIRNNTLSQDKSQNQHEERLNTPIRKHLPDVIIAGVKKCGTGALKTFLSCHPSVAMTTGEVHYFDINYSRSIHWYVQQMPVSTAGQLVIEKTPNYFDKPDIPRKVYKDVSPQTKIVFVFCDPVTRAVSDYVHVQHMKLFPIVGKNDIHNLFSEEGYRINDTFESSVLDPNGKLVTDNPLISVGVYIKHLQNWLKVFPSSQIHILDGDVFKTDPSVELQSIETFLNIKRYFTKDNFYFDKKQGFYCLWKPQKLCLGEDKGRTHPKVRQDVLDKLKAYYQPFNRQLVQISKLENLTDHTLNFH